MKSSLLSILVVLGLLMAVIEARECYQCIDQYRTSCQRLSDAFIEECEDPDQSCLTITTSDGKHIRVSCFVYLTSF